MIWYIFNGRHTLPWRIDTSLYSVLVSEFMLQQTPVSRVLLHYKNFFLLWPSLDNFVQLASISNVLEVWKGLGYSRRALYVYDALHKIYKFRYSSYQDFLSLSGVGSYTSSAIVAFSLREKSYVIDVNVFRVMSRVLNMDFPLSDAYKILPSIIDNICVFRWNHFYYALMDFGSAICKKRKPLCSLCVINNLCISYKNDKMHKFSLVSRTQKKHRHQYFFLLWCNKRILFITPQENNLYQYLYTVPRTPLLHQSIDYKNILLWAPCYGIWEEIFTTTTYISSYKLYAYFYTCYHNSSIPHQYNNCHEWVCYQECITKPLPSIIEKGISFLIQNNIVRYSNMFCV